METVVLEAVTSETVSALAELAHEIWFEYWPSLIGADQTSYMVDRFQSLPAIERDMRDHAYEYWFVRAADDGRIVGYTGGHVSFYERLCRERGLSAMYLTVNKGNDLGVRAYRGNGFSVIDAVEIDIGQGFIMDDYIMEKCVK